MPSRSRETIDKSAPCQNQRVQRARYPTRLKQACLLISTVEGLPVTTWLFCTLLQRTEALAKAMLHFVGEDDAQGHLAGLPCLSGASH